ncbi:hypothetical protein [uncultured Tateyamaria sp.]|uniref:hypothetical protein n=1 Tax=uncultured Tateyamaria sp. TaxID=455651 RepID=UPI0026045150|nr:hypothetical protein [uncultured Tateyamaria sp.]
MLNNIGLPGILLLLFLIIFPLMFWKIFTKAGFSGFWDLFSILPGGVFVLLLVLALVDWPANRKSDA